jgi:hypothetical protein
MRGYRLATDFPRPRVQVPLLPKVFDLACCTAAAGPELTADQRGHIWGTPSRKANPAKAGGAKPRVLASSAALP